MDATSIFADALSDDLSRSNFFSAVTQVIPVFILASVLELKVFDILRSQTPATRRGFAWRLTILILLAVPFAGELVALAKLTDDGKGVGAYLFVLFSVVVAGATPLATLIMSLWSKPKGPGLGV